jgi:hypothetical protein
MARIARQQVIAQAAAARDSGIAQMPSAGPATGPAAREALRDSAAEGGPVPAVLPAMDEVVAVTVHALTAVIDNGAIVASEVVGTNVGGIHLPGAQGAAGDGGDGGEGYHAGSHGDGDHAGGFGHH